MPETTQKKYRVVYLDHVAILSGAELALARLLPALDEVDATVILGEDGPLRKRLEESGIRVEILPLDPATKSVKRGQVTLKRLPIRSAFMTIKYVFVLARRLRQLRPDIVHANSLKASVYGTLAAKIARVPVVWHMRDRLSADYLPAPAVRLTRWMVNNLPDAIVANSASTLETAHKANSDETSVIPSPVIFDPGSVFPKYARATSGFVLGMVGRLADWKGQDVFLKAFAQAFPNGDERAVIVGSAMFGEDDWVVLLHSLVIELGIEKRVSFVGFVEDVPRLLAEFDVLVHASIVPEPFGQVIIEGMAAGLPVIATKGGGPSEIIEDGENGLLYEAGNVDQLANLLRLMRDDTALKATLGVNALNSIERFTPEVVAGQMQDLYATLI